MTDRELITLSDNTLEGTNNPTDIAFVYDETGRFCPVDESVSSIHKFAIQAYDELQDNITIHHASGICTKGNPDGTAIVIHFIKTDGINTSALLHGPEEDHVVQATIFVSNKLVSQDVELFTHVVSHEIGHLIYDARNHWEMKQPEETVYHHTKMTEKIASFVSLLVAGSLEVFHHIMDQMQEIFHICGDEEFQNRKHFFDDFVLTHKELMERANFVFD